MVQSRDLIQRHRKRERLFVFMLVREWFWGKIKEIKEISEFMITLIINSFQKQPYIIYSDYLSLRSIFAIIIVLLWSSRSVLSMFSLFALWSVYLLFNSKKLLNIYFSI